MTTQALSRPTNLDFEAGKIGKIPESWASPTQQGGYSVRLSDENPKRGRLCVEIAKPDRRSFPKAPFGNVMQMIDAKPFRGKRLRYTGWARAQSVLTDWLRMSTSRAQAWMRVDKSLGTIGFLDSMQDRPIRSNNWTRFEIVGDVANDAEHLNLGLILQGKGKAWLDDVQIDVLGDGGVGNQSASQLSPRQLNNIVALTRLIGYVRFFHPTKTVARTNWDLFTINAIRHIENADSPIELAHRLNNVFKPIAPKVQIEVCGTELDESGSLGEHPSDPNVRCWLHLGVNLNRRSIYSSKRRTLESTRVFNLEPIRADLGGGVTTLVPTTIPTKDSKSFEGTAFKKLRFDGVPSRWRPSSDDRSSRIASVILIWNVIQHFYPYFDVVDTDWFAELKRTLENSATDESESDFYKTLEQFIATLRDGHGAVIPHNLYPPSHDAFKRATPPVAFDWVDDSIVVTAISQNVDERLQVGDVITEIGGKSIEANIASIRDRISAATSGQLRLGILTRLIIGPNRSKLFFKARSGSGEEKEISLERVASSDPSRLIREPRPEQGAEVSGGVIYVDLTRRNGMRDFTRLLPKLADARGIVFDVRGYAGFEYRAVVSYLID
ncbi:MAG: hypothetical protein OXG05_10085 [Gammaproteobacteria bacterium]|nr:hypothetical protein [Gammaproteobacteria bacterium]